MIRGRNGSQAMRVLFSTHTRPGYMDPPLLSAEQVVCGPERPDRSEAGRAISLKTPLGPYDLAQQIDRLPAGQRPELVVVRADATRRNRPGNLAGVKARRVLLIGDTHHGRAPIEGLIRYARSEPFDLILLDYTRQHAHFFLEAGLNQVRWLPAIAIDPPPLPEPPGPRRGLVFMGQLREHHHQRRLLIDRLIQAGLKPELFEAIGRAAQGLHAAATVSFNCSLNGDLNQRVFEVLAAGGCLLTDRLAPQAGLELLFEPGRHLRLYEGPADLLVQAQELLADPPKAAAIAAAGLARYREGFNRTLVMAEFADLLEGRDGRPAHALAKDPRCTKPAASASDPLAARLALYQGLQELHRREPALSVLFAGDADPDRVSDAVDLPRLEVAAEPTLGEEARRTIERLTAPGQVVARDAGSRRWDVIVAATGWIEAAGGPAFLERHCRAVAVTDPANLSPAQGAMRAGFAAWRDYPALLLSPDLALGVSANSR
jgi:glycosyl transferase family 1